MGLILVSGGQYGSEGKGKISAYLAEKNNAVAAVRVGGPNSGHTVYRNGEQCKLRMLPSATVRLGIPAIFPAGSYLNMDILEKEIRQYGVSKDDVYVDKNAFIIEEGDIYDEDNSGLGDRISSTLSGTGYAVARRVKRQSINDTAKDVLNSEWYVCDTKKFMNAAMSKDECIVVEGTQGYELSLLHTQYYPYCTARDTSFAGILSETGMSIRDVDKTCMTFRTYPIRVGGPSGPLPREITWDKLTQRSGSAKPIKEFTTVTNKPRRVAEFDYNDAYRAINNEKPDIIAMNFLDYIDANSTDPSDLSWYQVGWIERFRMKCGRGIDIIGLGPDITSDDWMN